MGTHWTERLQKLKMYTHILLLLSRLYLSNVWHTHTHTLSLSLQIHTYTLSVTHRHVQNTWISTWRYFSSGVHHRSTQENLLHCSFTRAWQNLQQDASSDYYILWVFVCSISYTTTCKTHVPCHIAICGLSVSTLYHAV